MKKLFAMLLCLVMVLSLLPSAAFAEVEEATPAMTEEAAAAILKERRDTVYNNMLSMANILWRASEDVNYSFSTSKVTIVKGRLYRGIPYTYARGNLYSFMDYVGEPNEKGEYTLSGVTSEMLEGSGHMARIGNDCSGAATAAYGTVSATTCNVGSATVTVNKGFIPVGPYIPNPASNSDGKNICINNGYQVMFESYALAQYADLVACSGHTMMTQKVSVVRNEDGTIDGDLSTMTVVHQNPDPIRNNRYFTSGPYSEENYGEKVYRTFLIDDDWTFNELFAAGYMPYTCIELIDPSPIPEVEITDSISEHSFATILDGKLSANRLMEGITMTITDEKGETVQQGTARVYRTHASDTNWSMDYDMNQLKVESPMKMKGHLNINQLGVGNYHCRVDVRLFTGQTVEKVRDFDFTVTEKDLKEGWVDNSNLEFTEVDGKKMAVCPVCGGDPVEWTELPQISSNISFTESHYYVAKDLNNKARYIIPRSTVCIHLNGHNITSTSQVFWLNASQSMLNVMGNGIVKGSYASEDNNYGATMHFSAATAKASLYGGTFGKSVKSTESAITLEASQPKLTIYSGATICRMEDSEGTNIEIFSGSVELRGGKILDGTTINNGYGGNVRVVSSGTFTGWPSTFTMYDGVISGGRAKYGGNVYVYRDTGHGSKPRTFTMEGGILYMGFAGYAMGNAGSGGNIWAGTGSVLNLNGGLVTYGKSYSSGGNIYAKGGSQVTIGGIVENGNGNHGSKAEISGGNVYLLGAAATDTAAAVVTKLTVTGTLRNPLGTIGYGGNIFCSHSDVTVDGGTIENGIATSRGGNIYMTNAQANLTLKNGGKIINGSAPNGGNVGTNIPAAKITVESGEISGGTATTAGPDVRLHAAATVKMTGGSMGTVYGYTGKFTLSGDSSIQNLTMTTGTLKLDAAWKGSMNLSYDASTIQDGKLTKVTCGDSILGKVMYNNTQPVKGIDGAAYLANATVGDEVYLTAAEALAAADGKTVKLYTDDTITLEQDAYLDINGHNITATGTGTVYGIDSSNDDYEGCGTLTYAGEIAPVTQDPITGKQYVAIAENGTATFHRLGAQLTAVTLRPDAAGLYFKAKYECDEALEAQVKNYGMVLSVNDLPSADFATEEGDINIATVGTAPFASGLETTSTSVFGILKNSRKPELNDRYGKMPIYANTYVELADGTIVMGENGAERSLYDVMTWLNENYAALSAEDQASAKAFYATWADAMAAWNLPNLAG